jgi:ABC-type antimicrobial peptide transport system permease subunit
MLLIACLNLSNLLVARSAARRKEVAIRAALGGSRLALVREQLTESLLICLSGGGLGLLISLASTHLLATHWRNLPRAEAVHVDGWVFAFALAFVVTTALLAGLVPAISSTGRSSLSAIRESSRSIGKTTASQGFAADLLLAFAGASLLLAGVGLYGVLSYLVAQRMPEMGIRIALRAQRSEVMRVVLVDGLKPVLIGAVMGLVGAAVAGSLIRSMLYGASPYDPLVIGAIIACLLATATAACLIPAWRASHVDPMQALRSE